MARKTTSKTKNTKSNKKLKLSWWGRKSKNQKVLMVAGLLAFGVIGGFTVYRSSAFTKPFYLIGHDKHIIEGFMGDCYKYKERVTVKDIIESNSSKKGLTVKEATCSPIYNYYDTLKISDTSSIYKPANQFMSQYRGSLFKHCITVRNMSTFTIRVQNEQSIKEIGPNNGDYTQVCSNYHTQQWWNENTLYDKTFGGMYSIYPKGDVSGSLKFRVSASKFERQ